MNVKVNNQNRPSSPINYRRGIIFGGIFFGFLTAFFSCQETEISSGDASEKLLQVHALLENSPTDSVAFLLQEAEVIQARSVIPDSLRAHTYYHRGKYLYQLGQLDSAAVLFHQAISLIQPPISRKQLEYFRMAWRAYSAAGEYGECFAISNTLESLLGTTASPQQKALLYFIREHAYRQQGDFGKAMDLNQRYIEQLELARDTYGLVSANISKAFYPYYINKDVDGTFAILDTLVMQEDQYSPEINCLIYGEYGVYLFFEGLYRKALSSYRRGLYYAHKMEEESGQGFFLATAYSNIAEAYIQLNDYHSAQVFLDSVHQLGLMSIPENVRNNTLRYQLELVYRDRQGLEPIMGALDSILWYQDQQFLQRNESELQALQLANKKEKILLEQNKQEELQNLRLRSRQTFLLIIFAIILWIGYLLYRQRQLHFEKQELQLHQRLLRAQMNPHFTFNTLYAIQNLINKDPEKAITYQLKFSRLLRLILKNSTVNFVQLDDELTAVERYLDLQLLRFPGKFEYKIVLEGVERDSLIFIPPMLIQPMIENCIEHGFAGIDYMGLIQISLSKRKDDFLFCSIKDNGVGIFADAERASKAKSTELIDALLKKLTPQGLSLTNNSERMEGAKGALVEFLIPCKNTPNG